MDPEVIRYIAENRERYTREAIDAHLLSAGHTQAEIDAAWSQVGGEEPPLPLDNRAFWRAWIGAVAGVYGITFLVYAGFFYLSVDEGYADLALVISAIFLAALLVAALVSVAPTVALVRRNRSARRGMAGGLLTALVIPFVLLIIIAGLCTSIIGAPFASSGILS